MEDIRNRNKAFEPSTEDKILENHELKKVLQFADIKAKSMFLLVSSSGIRINELVAITWDDYEPIIPNWWYLMWGRWGFIPWPNFDLYPVAEPYDWPPE